MRPFKKHLIPYIPEIPQSEFASSPEIPKSAINSRHYMLVYVVELQYLSRCGKERY